MENASKALIMAGSILLSLMVISTVVLMYNQISDAEQAKVNSEEAGKLTDYSLKFEKYNRKIYGSELMSLANLQEDYNLTQTGEKGYEAVDITVEIKNSIAGTTYFSAGNKNMVSITTDKNALENDIEYYEETKKYEGRVVKYYAQMSNREIAHKLGVPISSSDFEYDIEDKLKEIFNEQFKTNN